MLNVQVGSLSLSVYIIAGLFAVLTAVFVAALADRRGHGSTKAEPKIWLMVAISIACGRAVFVAQYFSLYKNNLVSVFNIRDGGFSLSTAILVFILALIVFVWRASSERKSLLLGSVSGLLMLGAGLLTITVMNHTGEKVQNIQLVNIDNNPVHLHEFLGKPSVINIWASWCPPCLREMPAMQAAQNAYPDINFVFVNQRESHQLVQNFLAAQNLSLDNVLLDRHGLLAESLNSSGLPTTVFTNKQGRVVHIRLGELSEATLASRIKSLTTGVNIHEP